MPYLSRILIFPIKSLDGVAVESVRVLPSGALAGDREFALVDAAGALVNGKRTAKIHQIRSQYDLAARTVTLRHPESSAGETFHLDRDRAALAAWFSNFFGQPLQLQQDTTLGIPDDPDAPGPTVISTATLETVASWFPELSMAQMRQRFRTNLEVADCPPFWEDQLFGAADELVPFHIGAVPFLGVNPCQRCIVPVRDATTGEPYPQFQTIFAQQRAATLPTNVARSRFNHFYRLAVNTRPGALPPAALVRVGDPVSR